VCQVLGQHVVGQARLYGSESHLSAKTTRIEAAKKPPLCVRISSAILEAVLT